MNMNSRTNYNSKKLEIKCRSIKMDNLYYP